MSLLRAFLAFILVLVLHGVAGPAIAEPRVALVIGNSNYGGDLGVLANSANDAKLMARTLRGIGFTVIEAEDADQNTMKRAIVDFGQKLADAGTGSTGLFYYAGHGLQVGGSNYLIPVHADIQRELDVDIEAVPADLVLKQMDFAGSAVNIVILDACRNNPLSRGFRDMSRGLAEITQKPLGSFIGYSTAPGDVAVDGSGDHSPYTEALAAAIVQPGIGIEEAFREVRTSVITKTGGKQVPWDSSSLTAPFFFVPGAPPAARISASDTPASETAAPPASQPAASGNLVDPKEIELAFWSAVQSSNASEAYQAYLDKYPDGDFVPLARLKIAALKPATPSTPAPSTAAPSPAPASAASPAIDDMDATYAAIQSANIRTAPGTEAKVIAQLKEDDVVAVTGKVRDKDWYRVQLSSETGFVSTKLLQAADAGEAAAWHKLKQAPSPDAVQAFLKDYPGGTFKPKAQALLAALQAPPKPGAPATKAAAAANPSAAAPSAPPAGSPAQPAQPAAVAPAAPDAAQPGKEIRVGDVYALQAALKVEGVAWFGTAHDRAVKATITVTAGSGGSFTGKVKGLDTDQVVLTQEGDKLAIEFDTPSGTGKFFLDQVKPGEYRGRGNVPFEGELSWQRYTGAATMTLQSNAQP